MNSSSKSRLGRGLSNLISKGVETPSIPKPAPVIPIAPATNNNSIQEIPLKLIETNPYQPRRHFNNDSIHELAESIRSEGLLQPIIVRKKNEKYELIAGERRLRACQELALKAIPARIIEASNSSSAVISLIENLQRENLNPIDESLGFSSLMQDFGLTQEAVAQRLGKGRATIANALRLLQLDKEVQAYISKGLLSAGHAKVILSIEDKTQQGMIARKIIEGGLSVRETEQLLKKVKNNSQSIINQPIAKPQNIVINNFQKQMTTYLNTKVALQHTPKKGKIIIEYYGNDDLQRILDKMGVS